MVGGLIERYKTYRKQKFLKQFSSYKHKYAFVGVGNHSINNLYPVIDYLGIPLKYICTKNIKNANMMAVKYGELCTGTDDLSRVLNDDAVKGVFICTSPEGHYSLSKKVLESGKALFVEKPPCLSKVELEDLISKSEKTINCVGLQKRYSTVYSKIKLKAKIIISYNYRFATGSYPEGDPIWDLYIHPLDVCTYLFGEATRVNKVENGNSVLLQVTHKGGAIGSIELSTDYSWSTPIESLSVNAANGIFECPDLHHLSLIQKSKTVMGIPLEKILKSAPVEKVLYNNSGFVPTGEFNQVYCHGYYDEIKSFVDAVEGKGNRIKTPFKELLGTYDLIEKMNKN